MTTVCVSTANPARKAWPPLDGWPSARLASAAGSVLATVFCVPSGVLSKFVHISRCSNLCNCWSRTIICDRDLMRPVVHFHKENVEQKNNRMGQREKETETQEETDGRQETRDRHQFERRGPVSWRRHKTQRYQGRTRQQHGRQHPMYRMERPQFRATN